MPGDGVHMDTGAQHAAPAGDHVIQARVADHHPVYPARDTRALEVGFRAAEPPGVLIDVEQQHHAAAEARPPCPAGGRPRARRWQRPPWNLMPRGHAATRR